MMTALISVSPAEECLDAMFIEKGLRRISSLREILISESFLVEVDGSHKDTFIVYPVLHKRANLTHDMLNLYGLHWLYNVKIHDWGSIEQAGGDRGKIFSDLSRRRQPKGGRRFAAFAFTERMLRNVDNYWIFVLDTPGWDYYKGVLAPRFEADMAQYKEAKRKSLCC